MMKEQIDKEIRSLHDKKKKLKERDREIVEQKGDLANQLKNQELYSFEVNFNLFYEKKRREIKNLQSLNDYVKPNPYFLYYMFKDTIHVDDYGSIKETLFKFPTLNKVLKSKTVLTIHFRLVNKAKRRSCYSAMT
jgi:hypothetical protein